MVSGLTFTTLGANSTGNLMILFFSEIRVGNSVHEMSNPVFLNKSEKKKKKKKSKCRLLIFFL